MTLKNIQPSLICFALFFSANVFAQQTYSSAVQITNEIDHATGKYIFTANNQDFCDYIVFINFAGDSHFKTARPGKSELLRVNFSQQISYSIYRYASYRGAIDKKPNIDFAYCLPTAKGDSLIMYANVFSNDYQMVFTFHSDTIYASRDGIVCNDDFTDFTAKGYQHFSNSQILKKITIYHNDGTFGEYVFVGQQLVSHGNKIKMGQPVAVLSKNNRNVSFAVYFLDKNKIKKVSIGNKHTHFRPFFQTLDEGKVRLEEGKIYFCVLDNDMLQQDMSRRQLKKYTTNK